MCVMFVTYRYRKFCAVAKNVIGQIYARFESAGLKIVAARMAQLSRAEAEAFYGTQQTDDDGAVLDGSRNWVLRFEPGQLPPVQPVVSWPTTCQKERLVSAPSKTTAPEKPAPGSNAAICQRCSAAGSPCTRSRRAGSPGASVTSKWSSGK